MSEKVKSFEDWFNNHEFNHLKTGSHKERCEIAWTACAKMKDEEIEKLMVLQTELEAKNYDLQKENEELKLQNKKAINAFKALNRYLCNGEHVDLSWIKDEIQLQAESESLIKSKHFLESAKLKRDIDDLKKKLSEAVEVIKSVNCDGCCSSNFNKNPLCDECNGDKMTIFSLTKTRAFLMGDEDELQNN